MTLFGRPHIPSGGRPFVSDDDGVGHKWSVRVQMPGEEPTTDCKRVSPSFVLLTTAEAYRAWVAGEVADFVYPEGEA